MQTLTATSRDDGTRYRLSESFAILTAVAGVVIGCLGIHLSSLILMCSGFGVSGLAIIGYLMLRTHAKHMIEEKTWAQHRGMLEANGWLSERYLHIQEHSVNIEGCVINDLRQLAEALKEPSKARDTDLASSAVCTTLGKFKDIWAKLDVQGVPKQSINDIEHGLKAVGTSDDSARAQLSQKLLGLADSLESLPVNVSEIVLQKLLVDLGASSANVLAQQQQVKPSTVDYAGLEGSRVFLSLATQIVEQMSLGATAIRRGNQAKQAVIKASLQQMLKVTVTLLREYDCFKELRSVEELGSIFYRANCMIEEFPKTPATWPAEAGPRGCCEVAVMQVATKL